MADSGIKRNIPIKLGDFSVIDTEFSNIRERFDAEMRKMEDEMSRFRSELMNRESNNFFKSTTRYVATGVSVETHLTFSRAHTRHDHSLPAFAMHFPNRITVLCTDKIPSRSIPISSCARNFYYLNIWRSNT